MATVTYRGASWTYEEVERGGLIWMDRNLGATQAATSETDSSAYGHLFQWGRGDDGHQLRDSATTTTLYTTDAAGSSFVYGMGTPYDWRNPQKDELWNNGVNIPIPTGWRLPTLTELESERLSWVSNNSAGAYASTLKWTNNGYRTRIDAAVNGVNSYGYYWSSSIGRTIGSGRLFFYSSAANTYDDEDRAAGMGVRLIKIISGPANVKTYKGLASASVKTCKGLAIASVKTKKD